MFLDVDGAVAPLSKVPLYPGTAHWVDLFPGGVHLPADILDQIVSLHARGLVRVEWLSTWEHLIATDLAPQLELPTWHVRLRDEAPNINDGGDWWKQDYIHAALAAGECVIWCDDDIIDKADDRLLDTPTDRLLWIAPDPALGLTRCDLTRVENWALARLADASRDEAVTIQAREGAFSGA